MIRLILATVLVLVAAVGIFRIMDDMPGASVVSSMQEGGADLVARARTADPTTPALPGSSVGPEAQMASMTAGVVANIGRATGAAPAPAPEPVGSDLDALTRAVLVGLGAPPPSVAPSASTLPGLVEQAMQAGAGDAYVAALLQEAQGRTPAQPSTPAVVQRTPADLSALVERALSNAGSDAYLDTVLNAAVDAGQIAVPAALRTSDGRLDTQTLLADIVQKANGTPAPVRAPTAAGVGDVEGIEVRVVQTATETTDALFYMVQSGDSLGAIAQRFYGNASLYQDIFEANRRILSTPDRIRVGQRLLLPDMQT